MVVIQVGDGESAGKGKEQVQWPGELRRVAGIISTSFGSIREDDIYAVPYCRLSGRRVDFVFGLYTC